MAIYCEMCGAELDSVQVQIEHRLSSENYAYRQKIKNPNWHYFCDDCASYTMKRCIGCGKFLTSNDNIATCRKCEEISRKNEGVKKMIACNHCAKPLTGKRDAILVDEENDLYLCISCFLLESDQFKRLDASADGTVQEEKNTKKMIDLTSDEIQLLVEAKKANPYWFAAVLFCAKIMTPRRAKYSGNKHSYFNFVDLAKRMNMPIYRVFLFYMNIKMSRLAVSDASFSDESVVDTLADVANYALIALGWFLGKLTFKDVEDYEAD